MEFIKDTTENAQKEIKKEIRRQLFVLSKDDSGDVEEEKQNSVQKDGEKIKTT